jgi:hypothetical protein
MITKKVEVTGLLYSEKNFNAIGNILIQDISNNLHSVTSFDV